MKPPTPPLADPPLDPSGEEARSLLRDELADPAYYSDNLLERAIGWVLRWLDGLVDATSRAGDLSTLVAVVVALGLITAIALLASRARRTTRLQREPTAALPDERVSATEYRERAEAAFAAGRYDDALVDAYRALAVRQIERDRIEDLPQATAHELAGVLSGEFPTEAGTIAAAADHFDEVLYGDHSATAAQARSVLVLDDRLGAVRR